jgi:hypothetical protein
MLTRCLLLSGFLLVTLNGNPEALRAQEPGATPAAKPVDKPADKWMGKRIMITRAGAEMKTPQATVWRAYLGEVFTVTLTNGEWLWVDEKGGWLWEKDAVLFDSAIEELSRQLTASPPPPTITCVAWHSWRIRTMTVRSPTSPKACVANLAMPERSIIAGRPPISRVTIRQL